MFYTERITIYKEEKPTTMQTIIRAISGIVLIGGFLFLLSLGLNYLNKHYALENNCTDDGCPSFFEEVDKQNTFKGILMIR